MWIFRPDAVLSIAPHSAGMLSVRSPFRGDIERVFPGAEVERVPGDCYLYRATVRREAVAAAVSGLAMSVAGNGLLDACSKGDRHREELLRALLSGMRTAATCEEPMDNRRLATGQRFQHVTTDGRQCTVAVLMVQERMGGEPDAVLQWSGTEHREKMRLSRAQRILRDSALLP